MSRNCNPTPSNIEDKAGSHSQFSKIASRAKATKAEDLTVHEDMLHLLCKFTSESQRLRF